MPSILIAVAPNGARKSKESHPAIPLSAKEIGLEAKACMEAGASMIHLHVRNALGEHSLSVDHYQEAISEIEIQTKGKLLIQVTTEAVGKYSPDEQFGMIHLLQPTAVSIAIREIKKLDEIDINENFNLLRQNNILPQLIIYNHIDLDKYHYYLNEGILPGKAYPILLVLGKSHAQGSFELHDLESNMNISSSSLMVCAFGEEEFLAAKLASKKGWHTRIGFENNVTLEDGTTAKNNAELISQMAKYLQSQDKTLVTADNAKKLMTPEW